jgi:L-lactate utilization protein LutC
MGIFDKIFGKKKLIQKSESIERKDINSTPDELFVNQFKAKGGKFLYCDKKEEVLEYLKKIFIENNWEMALCADEKLIKNLNVLNVSVDDSANIFYTTCEHLIAEDGSILFSSDQLKEIKLMQYPANFIVFATTSQLIHNKDKALTSIKYRFKKEIPTNISAIKDYMPHKKDPNFLNYGNTNSKNLYLLLFEDL